MSMRGPSGSGGGRGKPPIAGRRAATAGWTRTKLLDIVDKELVSAGFRPDAMSVSFDAFNSSWMQYIEMLKVKATDEVRKVLSEVVAQLADKNFWAVYCASLVPKGGSDIWLFINRDGGEVITCIKGA